MVDSLRVPWGPLSRVPTLSLRAFAMSVAFPHSDYSAPSACLQGLGACGAALPCLLLHSPAQPWQALPCPSCRPQARWGRWHVLVAPSTLCGSPVPAAGPQVDLGHLRPHRSWRLHRSRLPHTTGSSLTGSPLREGLRGAALPVGRCVPQVIHRPLSQSNAPSWRLPFSAWHL